MTSVDVEFYHEGNLEGTETISVDAQSTDLAEFSWSPGTGGQNVSFIIDSSGTVSESDETNNTVSDTVSVSGGTLPKFSYVAVSPNPVGLDETVHAGGHL